MDDLVGSSLSTEAPALAFSSSGFSPVPEQSLTAIVVDLSVQAVSRLTPVAPDTPMDLVVPFDSSRPELVPDPAVLLQLALDWAAAAGTSERLQYYSADEGPVEPHPKQKRPVLRLSREDPPQQAAAALPSTKASKPKACHDGHPGDSARKPYIDAPYFGEVPGGSVRAAGRNGEADGRRASSTAQPTFGFRDSPETCRSPSLRVVRPSPSHGPCQSAASVARDGSAQHCRGFRPLVPGRLGAIKGLDGTRGAAGGSLRRSSFRLQRLGGRSECKGRQPASKDAGGACLRQGVFFAAVLQNMAKRMAPASSLGAEPAELLQQGVCLSRYWERFGGFAGQRDLGAIAHTLAHAMDALQAGRMNQVSDHLALLAVCVEQMSMDGGRAELGYQLTWLEEPPASMFTARSSKSAMHTRAFAPLASQRWVAIVLSYIKELDVIAAKRADMKKSGASSAPTTGAKDEESEDTPAPSRPKRPPRKKPGQ